MENISKLCLDIYLLKKIPVFVDFATTVHFQDGGKQGEIKLIIQYQSLYATLQRK